MFINSHVKMGFVAQLIPPARDVQQSEAAGPPKFTDANSSSSMRTPTGGSDVGIAGKPLDRPAGWSVSEDSPERRDQEEKDTHSDRFLQGVVCPVVGAGEVQSPEGRQPSRKSHEWMGTPLAWAQAGRQRRLSEGRGHTALRKPSLEAFLLDRSGPQG